MLYNLIIILFTVPGPVIGDINFSYDYSLTRRGTTTYSLQYFYEIPYSKLFFTKQENRFLARYQMTSQIWYKQELLSGKLFTKEIVVDKYEDTKSENQFYSDSLNIDFLISPREKSKLVTRIEINDLNSNNYSRTQFDFTPIGLASKIKFYRNHILNPKHTYSTDPGKSETLNISFEVYSNTVKNCSLWMVKEYETQTITKKLIRERTVSTQLHPTKNNIRYDTSNFFLNTFVFSYPLTELSDAAAKTYKIIVVGYGLDNKKTFEIKDSFLIENHFFYSDTDYLEMVNRLIYIAQDNEIKTLKQVISSKRDSAWNAFWKQHDATPTTEINETKNEYFLGIDYCIKSFSKGDKGYKSERAKIYMKYGQPDFIESRPFERYSNAYEIWYYYNIGKQFTFIDAHGFGEFTLYEEKRI